MMSSCRSKQVLSEQSSSAKSESVDSTTIQRMKNTISNAAEETETEVTWYDTSLKKDSITGLYPVSKKETTKKKKKTIIAIQAQSNELKKATNKTSTQTSRKTEMTIKSSISIWQKLAQYIAEIGALIGIFFIIKWIRKFKSL